jgi:nicotinamide-nucleotide amidase
MRPIHTAELVAVGSELTVGETRDTNSGELARALTEQGVEVARMTALQDDLAIVSDAIRSALGRSDLIVTTGGLGPTPDDLTRESIATAVAETPTVDPDLEAWLRRLFERRGMPFPDANLKQAWRIPSATSIPNDNGTAPGWWVDRPDGRVVVALPGPPRELRPMWSGWVLPRLRERGLGQDAVVVTLRTTGLGESMIAQRLGRLLDRDANPTVATYARHDAVDIRISARPGAGPSPGETTGPGGGPGPGESTGPRDGTGNGDGPGNGDAAALAAATEAAVLERIGDHVWGRGELTWADAIGERLAARHWRLAVVEIGTRGSLATLLGEGLGDRLALAEALPADHKPAGTGRIQLPALAQRVRQAGGAEVGLAVRVTTRGADLAVSIAIADPEGTHAERRLAFLGGQMGRTRAALLAAAVLHARLRG